MALGHLAKNMGHRQAPDELVVSWPITMMDSQSFFP